MSAREEYEAWEQSLPEAERLRHRETCNQIEALGFGVPNRAEWGVTGRPEKERSQILAQMAAERQRRHMRYHGLAVSLGLGERGARCLYDHRLALLVVISLIGLAVIAASMAHLYRWAWRPPAPGAGRHDDLLAQLVNDELPDPWDIESSDAEDLVRTTLLDYSAMVVGCHEWLVELNGGRWGARPFSRVAFEEYCVLKGKDPRKFYEALHARGVRIYRYVHDDAIRLPVPDWNLLYKLNLPNSDWLTFRAYRDDWDGYKQHARETAGGFVVHLSRARFDAYVREHSARDPKQYDRIIALLIERPRKDSP